MPILNKEFAMLILIGNFVNYFQIIKVGFFNINNYYFLEKKYNFKILNTRKINMRVIEITTEIPSHKVNENNHLFIF